MIYRWFSMRNQKNNVSGFVDQNTMRRSSLTNNAKLSSRQSGRGFWAIIFVANSQKSDTLAAQWRRVFLRWNDALTPY
ncbi:MAG: hypothetical protein ACI955_002023 [Zhongshania sp.]|jgi:hypothetical protein